MTQCQGGDRRRYYYYIIGGPFLYTNPLLKVVATAVDFLKFVKMTPGGEDMIHQFMGGQKRE